MANEIEKVEPPALPLSGEQYNRPFFDQFSNVLRLFFRRFTNTLNELLSTDDGGKVLYMPHGAFYSTQDQNAAAINTGYAVTFNNTVLSSNVTLSNNSRITLRTQGCTSST